MTQSLAPPSRAAVAVAAVLLVPAVASAATDPTNFEQYQLELLNRARANPSAEVTRLSGEVWGDDPSLGTPHPRPQTPSLNEGLPAGTITTAAKQPLAFNRDLTQAARDHSQWMIANSTFSHTGAGGSSPGTRMSNAGYAFTPAPASSGENIAASGNSAPISVSTSIAAEHHLGLFIDGDTIGRGHRVNMMNGDFREVGIGMAQGTTTIFGGSFPHTVLSTQDFAFTNSNAFLTGVVFRDNVTADSFYTPGEGVGGVTITATPVGPGTLGSTTTFGSGGYSLRLEPGTYTVLATGTNILQPMGTVTIGGANVKVDAVNPIPEPATASALACGAFAGLAARRRRRQWACARAH